MTKRARSNDGGVGIPAAAIDELRSQLRTSIPAICSMVLSKAPWLISLSFVGRIGSKELAAAALATTLCNVTGMSFSVGLSSGMATLAGQARGRMLAAKGEGAALTEKEGDAGRRSGGSDETTPLTQSNNLDAQPDLALSSPNLALLYLYRGIFIQLAFVLPVGCYWLRGIKPLLLYLGQGEELSIMTERYLRILTPGLWGYSINFTLTTWLQMMELAHVPAYSTLLGAMLHVPMNLFFIHTMGLGWLGVGVATTMFQIGQPIAMLVYLKGTKRGRSLLSHHTGSFGPSSSFWLTAKAAVTSVRGICQYLMLALPGILAISEWWASEICIFLAGRLHPDPDVALGAMAVYQSINSSCFMLPMGMSIAGSARIGNRLGAGDGKGARLSAKVCVATGGILSATLGCILYLTPHTTFPSLFTSDMNLIEMTSLVLPLLSLYVLGDGLQVTLNSIIKGCGRQCVLVPIVVGAYWCIALPLSWHLAFVRWGGTTDCREGTLCGVVGLVAGMTTGTWVHFVLLAAYCCQIDWRLEAGLAKERMDLEKEAYCRDQREIDGERVSEVDDDDDDMSLTSIASAKAIESI